MSDIAEVEYLDLKLQEAEARIGVLTSQNYYHLSTIRRLKYESSMLGRVTAELAELKFRMAGLEK